MRVVALLATYNEERFIQNCLEHLVCQGVEIYLVDNGSSDATCEIAQAFVDRGLIGIESMSRHGVYSWRPILERKVALAAELDADWFMHVDADEIRLPPSGISTLAEAFALAERDGCNAVNFMEFAFVPTLESPNHDHPEYTKTMDWYYPFLPSFPNRLNAWKRQERPVELAWSGGHQVRFPGLKMYPVSFPMRHYLFLSVEQARIKYVRRRYDPNELSVGWHRARNRLKEEDIILQPESELRYLPTGGRLDPSNPLKKHPLFSR